MQFCDTARTARPGGLTDRGLDCKIARTDATHVPAPDVTALLHAWNEGDLDARERVMSYVYDELRRRAMTHMRRERQRHLLQPTALVHEACLRLVDQRRTAWRNRAQFLAVAAEIMRRETVFHPWSEPINLGPAVNGQSNDNEPHIASDRQTLYFSSNRTGGLGGADLYVTTRLKR
jgi:hypothetical protein